jgi:transcriptional regulator GlxA family with amidase domain
VRLSRRGMACYFQRFAVRATWPAERARVKNRARRIGNFVPNPSLQSQVPGADLLMITGNWRLGRLIRHIAANAEDSLSLTRAAQICGLERTYFCRFFRVRVGMSFSEWNRRLRVERAKELLRGEHRSVLAIALAVGYKDITTFERNFRRCEQLSPVEYRKLQRRTRVRRNTTSADEFTRIAET